MVKIGIVIPTLHKGGAEKIASTLSLELPFDIEFILFENKISYPYKGAINILNIPLSTLKEPINILLRAIKIRSIAKQKNIDLLLAFDETASFVSILSGIPTIAAIHKSLALADKNKNLIKLFFNKILRFLYRFSCKVIVICNEMKEELINYLNIDPSKLEVIYNPHDIKKIIELSKEKLAIDLPENYILTIGRAEQQKGQWHLIRSFKEVVKRFPELSLVIVAQGSLLNKLKGLAKDLNLENNIIFIDSWVANPYPLIKNAKLFVLSSLFEGFPNVLIESMVLKTPIVSSSYRTGISEIVGKELEHISFFSIHERGILSKPLCSNFLTIEPITESERSLAEAIIYALTNNLTKQTTNAYKFANNLDKKKIIANYLSIINECIK